MFTDNHNYSMNLCEHCTGLSLITLHDYPTFSLFYCLACGIFWLTAITGSSIVFYVFWISGSLSQASKMLFLSLAPSDLGIGLMVLPLNAALMSQMHGLVRSNNIVEDRNVMGPFLLLKATTFLSTFFCGASLMTVGTISIDQYLSLILHLRYRQLMTDANTIWITYFLTAILEILLGLNASGVSYFSSLLRLLEGLHYRPSSSESNLCSRRSSKSNLSIKVAEHSFGSLRVYVLCQIMARERLQLTS